MILLCFKFNQQFYQFTLISNTRTLFLKGPFHFVMVYSTHVLMVPSMRQVTHVFLVAPTPIFTMWRVQKLQAVHSIACFSFLSTLRFSCKVAYCGQIRRHFCFAHHNKYTTRCENNICLDLLFTSYKTDIDFVYCALSFYHKKLMKAYIQSSTHTSKYVHAQP